MTTLSDLRQYGFYKARTWWFAVVEAFRRNQLACIAALVGAAIILVGTRRPVVFFEVEARTSEIEFELSPVSMDHWQELLSPEFRVVAASWRGFRDLETPAGDDTGDESLFRLRSSEPFHVAIEAHDSTRLGLRWEGSEKISIVLRSSKPDGQPLLRSDIGSPQGLAFESRGMSLPAAWTSLPAGEDGWKRAGSRLAGLRLVSAGVEPVVTLVSAAQAGNESRSIWTLEGGTESVVERHLAVPATATPMVVGDRVVFVGEAPTRAFSGPLRIASVKFWHQELDRFESYLVDGQVTFPDTPHRNIALEPRYLLSIQPESQMLLHSVRVGSDGLHVLLSGYSDSVEGGFGGMEQRSPLRFDVWYGDQVLQWVVSSFFVLMAAWISARFTKAR